MNDVLAALAIAAVPAIGSAQTIEWIRQFGTEGHDRAFAIVVNATGIYVAGATEGELPGQRSAGAIDAFVRKYDAAGTELWTRQFGTSGIDEVLAIALDDTGLYVGGDTQGTLATASGTVPSPHAFVRKYDVNGTELWTREFGSGRREEVLSMTVAGSRVYAAGDTTTTVPPYDDGLVATFDAARGDTGWSGAIGTPATDRVSAIVVDASGVFVAGATQAALPGQASAGDSDGFLRKYDHDGTEIWTRQFGTPCSDEVLSMALDASGLYLAGTTSGSLVEQSNAGAVDAFVRKYDFRGDVVWTRQFGTSAYDDSLGIAVGPRGLYLVGNSAAAFPGQLNVGDYDAFIRKFDAAGNVQWTQQFGSAAHDEALGVAIADSGVYVAGVTDGGLPGQRSKGSSDAFVIKVMEAAPRRDGRQGR